MVCNSISDIKLFDRKIHGLSCFPYVASQIIYIVELIDIFLFSVLNIVVSFLHAQTIHTDVLRAELPKILPPSYRGVSIRYIYYVRSTISGRWFVLDNNDGSGVSTDDLIQVVSFFPSCICQ